MGEPSESQQGKRLGAIVDAGVAVLELPLVHQTKPGSVCVARGATALSSDVSGYARTELCK